MHLKTRTWFLVSLLCFGLAGYFWHLGNERGRRESLSTTNTAAPAGAPIKALGANNFYHVPPLLSAVAAPASPDQAKAAKVPRANPLLTNRLSNTSKPLKELMRSESAVLLRNAFIDTSVTDALNIPAHLRAQGDPGSYVVQSRGPLDEDFRSTLKAAGASIISYIPNNAYLVRLSTAGADQMRALARTQSVLPWEPYYKLDLPLLALAVQNQQLPEDAKLNVLVFPGERQAGLTSLKALGAEILGEERSPFGQGIIVQARSDSLPALAALPSVQLIQSYHPRQLVNDLTRPSIGVATNSYNAPNHLGLTGEGVMVSVNDTGVDAGHPDFDNRVFGETLAATLDYDGHGTHVAGTIAGSGSMSSSVGAVPPGSSTNGYDFRGMAPKAKLFVSQIDTIFGPIISDAFLQETAARTNAFISNNSWNYLGVFDYDFSAASYDAAVRDAIPGQSGADPLLFVFAAGDAGEGDAEGQGGQPESIGSPATAKNVITVGAVEQFRGITNEVVNTAGQTNQDFFAGTDSDDQVASFSSRGNVGVGLEGPAGRFKPDVVAPGTFVISGRASGWKDPTAFGGVIINRIKGEVVQPGTTNLYDLTVPGNGVQVSIVVRSNLLSPDPFPMLPIYAKAGAAPDPATDLQGNGQATFSVTAGQWFYAIGNPGTQPVNYDLQTVIFLQDTNVGSHFTVLKDLNSALAPWYRYESGTSQAAPAVSGILALMQQFFEQRLNLTKDQNWPALMKAMLINGARPAGERYNLQVQNSINYQGWGRVDLTNSLPPAMNGGLGTQATWPIALFHTNALYTGQSHTRTVAVSPIGRAYPLRFTLVWTDPPGNPAASLKLVNDLDLVVSNNVSGEVYFGNNIPQGSDFNDVTDGTDTNAPPSDLVNNVENVFINRPVGSNYTVVVRAHRVNVNAVTTQTTGVLQDYALVISSANSLLTNTITVSDIAGVPQGQDDARIFVKTLTNGLPLLNERVGANNPLLDVLNNGVTNQWNFYVYRNPTLFTNVAFVTFLSPNLSRTRSREADIDLYVSDQPTLLSLNATAVDDAINWRNGGRSARTRGGTELIIYTNAPRGRTFYLGVKSEDQQAAEFGIFAIASDSFGARDANGNVRLVFSPAPAVIPDGSPELPQAAEMFAIVADPAKVRRIVLTNTFTHQNAGDLFGILTHPTSGSSKPVVLNNHRSFAGTQTFLYEDSTENDVIGSQIPDGPGRLRDLIGDPAFGLWRFTMIDNAQFHTGRVDRLVGYIEPEENLTNRNGITLTVGPQKWKYASLDVPFGVTNMIIYLVQKAPNLLPLDLYVRLAIRPDQTNYDAHATINPPGGSLALGVNDSPGLQAGNRYYVGVFNPNSVDVTFNLRVEYQYGLSPIDSQTYLSSDTPKPLLDDGVTNLFMVVTNNRAVADVKVGVRIDHPRISDLVLHLVSPQGARILLTENRGGSTATNYGFGQPVTYVYPLSFDGGPEEVSTNIDTGQRSGVIRVDYDFFPIPDRLRIYYDGNRIFDSGLVSGAGSFSVSYGPGLSTVVTLVMNEGGSSYPQTAWQYTAMVTGPWNYATFTDNANLGGPIKFGLPPYDTMPTNRLVLSNSFEGVNLLTNQTNFAQSDSFAGWQVLTNGVAVFTDTNHPSAAVNLGSTNWGTNYLALSSGQVALPLTNIIVADRDYVLTFAQRKISSSPTQSVDVQIAVNANLYRYLNVSNAAGGDMSDPQQVSKVRLCPGQEVLLTAMPGSEGDTNTLYRGLPMFGLIGCFSFNSQMLTSNTVASAPFYVGTNALITAPVDPGDYYLFLGVNNDNFDNPPPASITNNFSFFNATAAWQQCQYASGQVLLGANAIPIIGSANWKVETKRFLANPAMTNLVLQPDINTTLLLDSFQIDELVSTIYYQSEEPMAPFQGQSALGQWRLEVWDNRSGPDPANNGTLFSWSLRFVFADSPTAIPLTNGIPYTNVVRGDQIKYFVVEVPNEVTVATNFLVSTGPGAAGVELLYSPFGLPTGQSPPDPLPPFPPAAIPLVLTTNNPVGAEMPQGRAYYLGVRNVDPTEVNNFTIQADFNIRIVPLANGTPLLAEVIAPNPYSFAAIRANTDLAVNNMNYYYFDVASTDIVSATISVIPADGDVNLVLRRALPVVDLFPRPTFFDYESTQPSLNSELIIVNSNSLPVKVAPGRWYVGVYSTVPDAPVHYDIVASQATAPLWNYVDLTNGVPVPFAPVSSADTLTNFYRFVVDGTNAGVLFEIYGLTGDADLLVKRADLPAPDLYDFSFLQRLDFTTFTWLDELTALRTNIFIPQINATNWFLQIVNRDPGGGGAGGWVCAKVTDPVTGLLTDCGGLVVTNIFIPGGPFTLAWNSVPGEKYAIEQTTSLSAPWTTAKTIKAVGTKTTFTAPVSKASPARFYRIQQVR